MSFIVKSKPFNPRFGQRWAPTYIKRADRLPWFEQLPHFSLTYKKKKEKKTFLKLSKPKTVFERFSANRDGDRGDREKESSDAISKRCERKIDSRCHPGRGSASSLPIQMTYYPSLCLSVSFVMLTVSAKRFG